jgi:hypothetical protein
MYNIPANDLRMSDVAQSAGDKAEHTQIMSLLKN